jgi:transposase
MRVGDCGRSLASDRWLQPRSWPPSVTAQPSARGREFAAWMGLLPNQHSTGGKVRLYGISKRGNSYLRKILIHGARAVVLRSKRHRIAMGAWMSSLETRAPRNVLIVATAHKLARIAWAVLSTGQDYRAVPEALTV